ncbi:response regulator [Paenibacillus solani]|uniref:response regulator n=1 Tax=Paenibacillus solani TaxID=1705565 RepID=UPI003D29721A
MYKVVIADDEAVFRKYLRGVVDWEAEGFEYCGEAKNGMEAWELVQKEKPHLALIDINMPYMNGMDLAQKLKEFNPDMVVILVTGHSEFEYARKAIKIGIEDYILKPFDEEELLSALHQVKNNLQKTIIGQHQEQEERQLWRESFLNLLISGEYRDDDEYILHQMTKFDFAEYPAVFQVISVEIDDLLHEWEQLNDIRFKKYIISNLLMDLVQLEGHQFIFNGPENRIVSLLQFAADEDYEQFSLKGYNQLFMLIRDRFGFSVSIGIGNAGQGISSIRKSYMESVIALKNRISTEEANVVHYRDTATRTSNVGFYPSEMNENLLISLRLHDEEEIRKQLAAIEHYIRDRQLSGDYIHMILAGLVSLCLTYIYEIGKTVEEIFTPEFSPFQEITNQPTLKEAFEWITNLYTTAMQYSKSVKHSKSAKILAAACEYIQNHYQDSQLKVEEVSQSLYIQSRYLRRIFKQELGIGVSDYITDVRMQRAKELLLAGHNLKLSEISEMVGYGDPSHFSKSFKKYTGLPPSEYEVLHKK